MGIWESREMYRTGKPYSCQCGAVLPGRFLLVRQGVFFSNAPAPALISLVQYLGVMACPVRCPPLY